MLSNEQLYLAIGIPVVMNLATTGLIMAYINAKVDSLRDTWRSELRRVEEVLDARLKHLEER